MQLGTATILTVVISFCTPCLYTNCLKGGKRAGPHSQESHTIRQVFWCHFCFCNDTVWNPAFSGTSVTASGACTAATLDLLKLWN